MRFRPRLDATQTEVVEALRGAGASAYSLAAIGGGFPDLLVGDGGEDRLAECKNPKRNRSSHDKAILERQERWRERWRGRAPVTLRSGPEALAWLAAWRAERAARPTPHAAELGPLLEPVSPLP